MFSYSKWLHQGFIYAITIEIESSYLAIRYDSTCLDQDMLYVRNSRCSTEEKTPQN